MEYRHIESNPAPSRLVRIVVCTAIPLSGLFLAWFFWSGMILETWLGRFSLFCPFNKLTGFYCPLCGMNRAIVELLHFHILEAVRDNALIVLVLGPLAAYLSFREYIHFLLNRKILPALKLGKWGVRVLIAGIILFFVLRNIPLPLFRYLAPLS